MQGCRPSLHSGSGCGRQPERKELKCEFYRRGALRPRCYAFYLTELSKLVYVLETERSESGTAVTIYPVCSEARFAQKGKIVRERELPVS